LFKFVLISCILSLVFRLLYVLKFNYKFYKHKVNASTSTINTSVSVIISAKNEAFSLKRNLPFLLSQNFSDYEVIVADDYSTDDTINVLKNFEKQNSKLRLVLKEEFEDKPGKKTALTAAIKKAKNDILLFTDADCYPNSKGWIAKMVQHFSKKNIEIVLGFAPYIMSRSFLNSFIQFETNKTALSYFGFALNKTAYMGVGRNLAYRKSSLEKVNGFKTHENITSGDDDLTVIALAKKDNVAIEYGSDTWCYSMPENSFRAYIRQKNRHVRTAKHYPLRIKIWLFLYAVFHVLFYLSSFYLFFYGFYFFLLLYFFYIAVLRFEYLSTTNKLVNNSLLTNVYLIDFVFIFYYGFTFLNALFKTKNKEW